MANAKAKQNEPPRVTPEESELDLRRLLDVLVPQNNVEIVDVLGNEHRVSGAVAARTQIVLMRQIDELKELPIAESIDLSNAGAGGAGGVIGVLLTLAQDPQVVDGLAVMFQTAHPATYNAAATVAREAGIDVHDAADVFPLEEIVSALVPLFVRLAKRTGVAVTTLSEAV